MPDFYVGERLGETRATIVENSHLLEMHIARDGDGLSAGAHILARLSKKLGRRGIAEAGPEELLVEPWPEGAAEGQTVTLEIIRAAWREPGRDRLAKARPTRLAPSPAPGLASALEARGAVQKAGWPAEIETAWADGFEAAQLGSLAFEGGTLRLAPTPAFTAVDVDGTGPSLTGPALLTLARAIRLWGLGGSIVIDLPPSPDKSARTFAAQAFDAEMDGIPFERTAINGFGLMQIVRPRPGPSILERAQLDRAGTSAIALLDTAARDTGSRATFTGPLRLVAAPAVIRWIEVRPHLIAELARRIGRAVDLKADPMAGSGHVEPTS